MPILEEIQAAIENGRPKDAERLISRAVEEGIRPSVTLEEAMNAGEYYRNNDGDIPRILAAARSMRKGLNILEPYLEKDKVCFLGTVLLGTIEGDLHDVGKNLVAMMFRSAGFHVIDLCVDVSEKQFLKAVQDNPQVQIVCISSLLTTSMPEMRRVVKSLRESGPPNLKIMVGGGSVTQEFADEIGADAYTETAVDAAEVAKKFTN